MRRDDREIKDKAEMIDILNRGDVCHIAFVDNGGPYIIALNYGFSWIESGLILYFHCANAGKKLDVIKKNNSGCFIVDVDHELVHGEKGCSWGMKYKSVVGQGRLEIVSDEKEKKNGLDLLMRHYSGKSGFSYDPKVFSATTVLKMVVTEITGKKKV
jgi:nitroimidazol reductase NimA-like FMN-containing flavoprotein (pyridoxamine 5'-phosphate oxidase superfamily)